MDRLIKNEAPHARSQTGGPTDRLLAWPQVKEITGLSRTTAWRMQKAGDFPPPVQVSLGRVGWWQSDLDRWKASRAPKPLSEARPFQELAGRAAACGRNADDGGPPPTEPEKVPAAPSEKAGGRGRRRSTSPDQIAFDFGA